MLPLSYLFFRDRLIEIKESLELQNTEEQKIFEEEFEELGKYIKVFLFIYLFIYLLFTAFLNINLETFL